MPKEKENSFEIVSDWDSGEEKGEVRRERKVVRNKPATGVS